MKNEEYYDLIERYLNNSLPEPQRTEVENRLATDADFRADLHLQRAFFEHIGNAGEQRLHAALEEVLHKSPTATKWKRWKNLGLTALAALILVSILWFWLHSANQSPEQDVAPVPKPLPQSPAPAPAPSAPPSSGHSRQPIAMADFAPNPALDPLVGGTRSADAATAVDIRTPEPDAVVRLKNGRLDLPVQGMVFADSLPVAGQAIRLFLYSNRPEDWEKRRSLFDLPMPLTAGKRGGYDVQLRLSPPFVLQPGLYYLVAGQRQGSASDYATLWVGKIVVKK